MYLRAAHAEADIPILQQLIHENPLGILTTAIKSTDHAFIQSSHIPFVLDIPPNNGSETDIPPGVLRGHIAKQNPQAKALMEALAAQQEQQAKTSTGTSTSTTLDLELPDEVLILFNAPHHHYVTPKFYTETKPVSGKVVPTWNYAAVQAYGKIRVYCDSKSEATGTFLQTQVEDLSRHAETTQMGSYVELLKKNIIGIEVRIERLQGKFKMSQEMGVGDREGVVKGFEELGSEVGDGIARMVKERGESKDRRG
ncbi:hypothetical protein N7454_000678 [Penicillium verhagenii]|nr:hypothetical protein N7454_000678 [Penicillium verhagenii]